jgi:GT2 family glycosyltransferase
MIDLSIIIVSWNVRNELKKCLQSVYNYIENLSYEIYVVDNNSSDRTCEMVRTRFPDVRLIENKQNLGFARANNQAICLCKGRYVLLLNPDIMIYPRAFKKMINFMDSNFDVAACTCKILDDREKIFRFRTKELTIVDELFRDTLIGKIASPYRRRTDAIDYKKTQKVKRIPGTCMMVRKKIIEKIGMLDERYFLYVEDDDWCHRINKVGNIFYVASATIQHFQGKSSEQVKEHAWRIGTNARFLFYEKYYGFTLTSILRGIILCSSFISFIKWKGIQILKKRDKEIRRKISFYRSSMQACLNLGKKVI